MAARFRPKDAKPILSVVIGHPLDEVPPLLLGPKTSTALRRSQHIHCSEHRLGGGRQTGQRCCYRSSSTTSVMMVSTTGVVAGFVDRTPLRRLLHSRTFVFRHCDALFRHCLGCGPHHRFSSPGLGRRARLTTRVDLPFLAVARFFRLAMITTSSYRDRTCRITRTADIAARLLLPPEVAALDNVLAHKFEHSLRVKLSVAVSGEMKLTATVASLAPLSAHLVAA